MCTQMIEDSATDTGLLSEVIMMSEDCAVTGLHEEVDMDDDSATIGDCEELAD